ncbi:hypothetical protein NPIL_89251 [Nephila pilipes]|uniref:Uncharacterized protein n=1 Tax=Nephila pilipes TaxID=299642 RepID=A0A8X6UNZ0_NEPPI|nr:hypothetical protein NPIL_89251 [Nephila pilipes]
MILFAWLWFTIRFLFFNYWEIIFLLPILISLDGLFEINTKHQEHQGDKDPPEIGLATQKETEINEQRTYSTELDILIKKNDRRRKEENIEENTRKEIEMEFVGKNRY